MLQVMVRIRASDGRVLRDRERAAGSRPVATLLCSLRDDLAVAAGAGSKQD